MKAFTPAFLSGFYADTSDVDPYTYEIDAEQTAFSTSLNKVYSTFHGVDITTPTSASELNTRTEAIDSAMFPVWFMSYRNGDRVAYATVNGQTGKVVTDLPIDTKKYAIGSLVLAVPIFILLNLFFTITPSVLLFITSILAFICLLLFSREQNLINLKERGKNDRGRADKENRTNNSAPVKEKTHGPIAASAALILGIIILVLQPASDIFYYIASIASLGALFITIRDIIQDYNILATRRLPQFDRTGGDDRA